jgi:signal peptidase
MLKQLVLGLALLSLCAVGTAGFIFWHHGERAYIIHTGSMDGTYDIGDLVIDKQATGPLHIGDVITFQHSGSSSDVVTHRIVGLSGGTIQTKGDANPTPDVWTIRYDQVKGVVGTSISKAGYIVYFFKQRSGDAAAATGVLALVLLSGLFFGPPAPATERGTRGHRRTLESTSV